jgi:predicted metal-dependent peptidase
VSAVEDLQKKWETSLVILGVVSPFYSHLLYKADVQFVEESITARVNSSLKITFGVEFARALTQPQFTAILLHEILHPLLGFHARATGKDEKAFNIAHDYIVNGFIAELSTKTWKDKPVIQLVEGMCYHEPWASLTAESVYSILAEGKAEADENGEPFKIPCWTSDGEVLGDYDQFSGDIEPEELSGTDARLCEERYKQYLSEAVLVARQRGDSVGRIEKMVKELLTPVITWGQFLRSYVGPILGGSEWSYARPSRRSEAVGEFLPRERKSARAVLTVLWDTSGSMDGTHDFIFVELRQLALEMGHSIRFIQCDTTIHADEIITADTELVKIRGYGGSDFSPAFSRLSEEGEDVYVIAMTDGDITIPHQMPEHVLDVLWVLSSTYMNIRRYKPKYGEAIAVDLETKQVRRVG